MTCVPGLVLSLERIDEQLEASSFRTSAVPAARRSGNQMYVSPKARLLTTVAFLVFASLTNVSGFQIGVRLRLTCLE